MTAIEEFTVEVQPGHLEFVGRCTTEELFSAALLLLVDDDEGDDLWAAKFQIVKVALTERLKREPPPSSLDLYLEAMFNLPFPVRQQVANRLREGVAANEEKRWQG
jgi:hypothetical protein